MSTFESAALPELEIHHEMESEGEMEGEYENEEFLSSLRNLASRAATWGRQQVTALQTPGTAQRQWALRLAHTAVQKGLPALAGVAGGQAGKYVGGALAGAVSDGAAAPVGEKVGAWLGQKGGQALGTWAVPYVDSWIPAREMEWEFEQELNPVRRIYPDALMEHLGHAAKEAQTEAEAEAFIGALIPLAARLIPRVAPAIMRAAPGLIRGAAGVVQAIRRNPATRPMVRMLPTILRRTAADIARQSRGGVAVPPAAAVRALGRQTATVLASPRQCSLAWRRSRALDQQYHRLAASGASMGCPTCGGRQAGACPHCGRGGRSCAACGR
ncbi:MAG TPA: hypothetical protein VE988_30245 [Gemmataceae bacterium]|nr:hypothetical protein [Gemmataceae bacterium]